MNDMLDEDFNFLSQLTYLLHISMKNITLPFYVYSI